MFKRIRPISLILLAGAFSFPKDACAEPTTVGESLNISQQSGKCSGVVEDEFGPVAGASVIVKGTTNGIMTDMDGNFTLEGVKKGDIIVISFIGYTTQEIPYTGQTSLQIKLAEDTQKLDEVVVVGFGTQKKVNLTGSVGTVNSEALESRPVVSATQALQGMVPGLQISSSSGSLDKTADIQVRGTATIGEGSKGSPLVLIDGMEGDINSINPQDIENISVLKDAAASSIYGSRAPFGVILITTKSGRTGKPVVNYNNSFRWNDPVKTPNQMDSYTFATFYNDAAINAGQTPHFTTEHLQRIKDFQNGTLTDPITANGQYWADGYAAGNANTNWYDALYRNWAFSQEHNLSVNGGTEKINYYLSMNFLDQNGLMVFNQDKYKRYTTTAKINVTLTEWAKFNYSNRFTREDYGRPSDLTDDLYYNLARQGWPTLPLYDSNGYLYSSPSPALGLRDGGRDKTQTDNLYQQASLILEPIKNWVTHVDFNYRIKSANRHWDKQLTYNHDVDGNPYVYNQSTNVHEDYLKENYMNINAYTEYSHSLESGHNFKAMVGFQCERLSQTKFGLQRNGIIVPGLPEIDITTGLDYQGNPVTPSTNGSRARWSTAGFFGRLNYDYQGKYLAEINLRYDGTSRFREDQRWNWFPSFSVGWNVAREEFWGDLADYVGTFKFRGSYGELGNQNTTEWYPTYQSLSVKASDGKWLQGGILPNAAYVPALISSSLGWERVRNWNVGLDFGALNNRLTGSFDYYQRKTLDMIGPAPELPAILGLDVPKTNNTDLKTYGFDLNISWQDRLKNGLGYGVTFILSDAQTEITRYPNPTGTLDKYNAGRKMGEIWGYETIGIAKSQSEMDEHLASLPNGGQNALGTNWAAGDIMYADLNGDGKIDNGGNKLDDHGDLKVVGNDTPRFQFGLDLNADWKGFDFRAFFQGVMKRDYWQGSAYFWGVGNSGIWHSTGFVEHADYFRAEQSNDLAANLNAYYPRPIFDSDKNNKKQTRYLQNAAYIRLKNIQLGYTLPSAMTNKFFINKLRVFVSGENLWTGTSLANMFDPETVSGGKDNNGNAYPLSKTISFGVSVTL
ncbi:TonB-dependent receptor [Parabacteroides acidifaciens]|uniref:TonB-dependent receptor n=1 Tax=Parabacteroides acidifaciens TaxID=2290935 RepID=A0A3D8H9W6_9BACT|nr:MULTISPECIES: TonB-dependent receptor [Parabacteroides]MBC8603525.1 TonB-dependent receptor [Parabacteroides acidifaciens]RDU47764.1 TonB-dependent receptor [Parabacteroides acidifaciens]RHR61791.1 TonB-dependent receptor [Parabacteroides sp. AF17-28]